MADLSPAPDPLAPSKPTAPPSPAGPPTPGAPDPRDQKAAPAVEQTTTTQERPPAPKFTQQGYERVYDEASAQVESDEARRKLNWKNAPEYKPPKAPEPKYANAAEMWGSPAMAMAMIGSMFTRTPLTTGLNAAAGVMNAIKKQDTEEAQMQFEQWKEAKAEYDKAYNFQREVWKDIDADLDKDETRALAKANAYGTALQHVSMIAAAKDRNIVALKHLRISEANLNRQIQISYPKMLLGGQAMIAMQSPYFKKLLANAKTPQEVNFIKSMAATGLSYQDITTRAQQLNAGDYGVLNVGAGDRGALTKAMIWYRADQMLQQEGKGGQERAVATARYLGLKAGERAAATKGYNVGVGVKEIERLAPLVKNASDALKRTNAPSLNSFINAWREQSGDPALRQLALNLQGFKNAYTQVMKRGGASTDSAQAVADHLFSERDPKRVIDTVLQQAALEGYATMGAISDAQQSMEFMLKGQSTGPMLITSQEQFNALPTGAHYYNVKGKEFTKPPGAPVTQSNPQALKNLTQQEFGGADPTMSQAPDDQSGGDQSGNITISIPGGGAGDMGEVPGIPQDER